MKKELCGCGRLAIAKGLCRLCYDKQRKIPRIAISEDIKEDVVNLSEKMGWSISTTCNYLLKLGVLFLKKQEKIKNEWGLS